MQWNTLDAAQRHRRCSTGLPEPAWFYFVHSFAPDDLAHAVATCDYGGTVVAAVERGNVAAMQFHPEKSGANGLHVLANFVRAVRRVTPFDLYPSIDLRGGRVVRLPPGRLRS